MTDTYYEYLEHYFYKGGLTQEEGFVYLGYVIGEGLEIEKAGVRGKSGLKPSSGVCPPHLVLKVLQKKYKGKLITWHACVSKEKERAKVLKRNLLDSTLKLDKQIEDKQAKQRKPKPKRGEIEYSTEKYESQYFKNGDKVRFERQGEIKIGTFKHLKAEPRSTLGIVAIVSDDENPKKLLQRKAHDLHHIDESKREREDDRHKKLSEYQKKNEALSHLEIGDVIVLKRQKVVGVEGKSGRKGENSIQQRSTAYADKAVIMNKIEGGFRVLLNNGKQKDVSIDNVSEVAEGDTSIPTDIKKYQTKLLNGLIIKLRNENSHVKNEDQKRQNEVKIRNILSQIDKDFTNFDFNIINSKNPFYFKEGEGVRALNDVEYFTYKLKEPNNRGILLNLNKLLIENTHPIDMNAVLELKNKFIEGAKKNEATPLLISLDKDNKPVFDVNMLVAMKDFGYNEVIVEATPDIHKNLNSYRTNTTQTKEERQKHWETVKANKESELKKVEIIDRQSDLERLKFKYQNTLATTKVHLDMSDELKKRNVEKIQKRISLIQDGLDYIKEKKELPPNIKEIINPTKTGKRVDYKKEWKEKRAEERRVREQGVREQGVRSGSVVTTTKVVSDVKNKLKDAKLGLPIKVKNKDGDYVNGTFEGFLGDRVIIFKTERGNLKSINISKVKLIEKSFGFNSFEKGVKVGTHKKDNPNYEHKLINNRWYWVQIASGKTDLSRNQHSLPKNIIGQKVSYKHEGRNIDGGIVSTEPNSVGWVVVKHDAISQPKRISDLKIIDIQRNQEKTIIDAPKVARPKNSKIIAGKFLSTQSEVFNTDVENVISKFGSQIFDIINNASAIITVRNSTQIGKIGTQKFLKEIGFDAKNTNGDLNEGLTNYSLKGIGFCTNNDAFEAITEVCIKYVKGDRDSLTYNKVSLLESNGEKRFNAGMEITRKIVETKIKSNIETANNVLSAAIIHELGHCIRFLKDDDKKIYNELKSKHSINLKKDAPTQYGATNDEEFVAESITAYMFSNADLKKHNKKCFDFIEDYMTAIGLDLKQLELAK